MKKNFLLLISIFLVSCFPKEDYSSQYINICKNPTTDIRVEVREFYTNELLPNIPFLIVKTIDKFDLSMDNNVEVLTFETDSTGIGNVNFAQDTTPNYIHHFELKRDSLTYSCSNIWGIPEGCASNYAIKLKKNTVLEVILNNKSGLAVTYCNVRLTYKTVHKNINSIFQASLNPVLIDSKLEEMMAIDEIRTINLRNVPEENIEMTIKYAVLGRIESKVTTFFSNKMDTSLSIDIN
jgi:hypothetical protein